VASKIVRGVEPAFFLTTGRFHGSRPDGPAAPCDGLIIHAAGVESEVVALPFDRFSGDATPFLEPLYFGEHSLFTAMTQLMQAWFNPLG
jgi:hypothetical protein